MSDMRQTLLGFLELDAYLGDQAVPATVRNGAEELRVPKRKAALLPGGSAGNSTWACSLGDLVATVEQATGVDVAVLDADQDQHGPWPNG